VSIYFTLIVESTENATWLLLKIAYPIGARFVHRLKEDGLECIEMWVRRQVGYDYSIWMKEVKYRIMLVQMLFGDEFFIKVERLDVHLFVWKQKGQCVVLLARFIVSSMLPYSCLQLSICSAYAERGSLFLMYLMCSRNLGFKFRLVCPT